ncbi:MAG TPA: hypothetical protein VK507_02345 [Iamia sp.]|nr:hypothetical protein [Iamia sp.]
MTPPDHDPLLDDGPLDDDTLAVHAVVDDEATPEQRRRVARDPQLVAQVAEMRAAVAAVAGPIDPPSDAVLAALRRRALDALDEAPAADTPFSHEVPPPADVPRPVRDISSAPTRRVRRLPPLPAVAAVVVLLVLLGVGLLIAGGSSEDEPTASGGASSGADDGSANADADADATVAGEGQDETDEQGQPSSDAPTDDTEATTGENEAAGPSDARVEELLAAATARYATEADLLSDLRRTDPDELALSGTTATDEGGNDPHWVVAVREWLAGVPVPESTTTTTVGPTTGSPPNEGSLTESFARDPIAIRCDDVQRSAEPELEPATAAALVEVDGIPVVVLSNPVEISDRAPSGIRLTVLNALDCSPRAAVLR